MSRFDQWLTAAKKDYDLPFQEQCCFDLDDISIDPQSVFEQLCQAIAPCATCALCNNTGDTYKDTLKLLEIPDE